MDRNNILSRLGKVVGNLWRNLSRKFRTKGKSTLRNFSLRGLIKSLWGRLGLVVGIIILLIATVVPVVKYYSLPINTSQLDWSNNRPTVVGDKYNILIGVYEQGSSYSFWEMIGLLRVDEGNKRANLVIVNPDLSVIFEGEVTELSKLAAKAASAQQDPMRVTKERVAAILGAQIDRYLVIEKQNAAEFMSLIDLNYSAAEAVEDSDILPVSQGESLTSAQDIFNYLGADEPGIQSQSERNSLFAEEVYASYNNLFTIVKLVLNIDQVMGSVETNMTRVELWQSFNTLLATEEIEVINTNVSDTFLQTIDGVDYYIPNTNLVDEQIQKLFTIPEVVREQVRIEIYNAAGVGGLAGKHQRWLENLGANVVRAGNYPELLDSSVLYNPEEEYPQNVELIEWVTRGEVEVVNERYPFNHTAELVLVLGSDVMEE